MDYDEIGRANAPAHICVPLWTATGRQLELL